MPTVPFRGFHGLLRLLGGVGAFFDRALATTRLRQKHHRTRIRQPRQSATSSIEKRLGDFRNRSRAVNAVDAWDEQVRVTWHLSHFR
jgi:hypothetical protein